MTGFYSYLYGREIINKSGRLLLIDPMTGETTEMITGSYKVKRFTISSDSKLLGAIIDDGSFDNGSFVDNAIIILDLEIGLLTNSTDLVCETKQGSTFTTL